MSKYAEDIRRIAKQKSLKGGLGDIQPREPIPGSVTPFIDEAFAPPSTTTDPSKKTPEATDPKNPNTFNKGDGTIGKNTDGFGGIDTNKNGPQDADDIIDGKAGPTASDNGISSIFSGGSLNKITGLVDCDNGKCVSVSLDGNPMPPPGWTDVDTPPLSADWEIGYDWKAYLGINVVASGATPSITATAYQDWFNSFYTDRTASGIHYISSWPLSGAITRQDWGYHVVKNNGFEYDDIMTFHKEICTQSSSSQDCPTTAPIDPNYPWQPDGCYEISYKNGNFSASQYDPDAPDSMKKPSSARIFCTIKGKRVKVRAASNGGTMIHEVNASGAAVGVVRVYNSDGTLRGAGDAAWIASQVPR